MPIQHSSFSDGEVLNETNAARTSTMVTWLLQLVKTRVYVDVFVIKYSDGVTENISLKHLEK